MQVRIFKPTKNSMQSGVSSTKFWFIKYLDSVGEDFIECTMGWRASTNMNDEISLKFASCEEAISFAVQNGYQYHVIKPNMKKIFKRTYADNFK